MIIKITKKEWTKEIVMRTTTTMMMIIMRMMHQRSLFIPNTPVSVYMWICDGAVQHTAVGFRRALDLSRTHASARAGIECAQKWTSFPARICAVDQSACAYTDEARELTNASVEKRRGLKHSKNGWTICETVWED